MIDWAVDSIFYHIYPIGFCGAPKVNNQDLTVNRIKKIKEWIPHM